MTYNFETYDALSCAIATTIHFILIGWIKNSGWKTAGKEYDRNAPFDEKELIF